MKSTNPSVADDLTQLRRESYVVFAIMATTILLGVWRHPADFHGWAHGLMIGFAALAGGFVGCQAILRRFARSAAVRTAGVAGRPFAMMLVAHSVAATAALLAAVFLPALL